MASYARELWRTRREPLTGDPLTRQEIVSLLLGRIVRRWTFLASITVFTLVWLRWGGTLRIDAAWATVVGANQQNLAEWNGWASWMALVVEGAIGIVFFSQTLRDAVQIRRGVTLLEQRVVGQTDLLVQLARHEETVTEALVAQTAAVSAAVLRLDEAITELLRLAHTEAEIQEQLARQDDSIVTALTTVRGLLEGQARLAHDLAEPIEKLLPSDGSPADPLRS